VTQALADRPPDQALLDRTREVTARTRSAEGGLAQAVLASTPFEELIGSMHEVLRYVRGYFDVDDAFAAVLRNDLVTVVSLTDPVRERPRAEPATSLGEVILTGSTLVLPDVAKYAAFARDLQHLPGVRSFIGVPVLSRAGVTVGALCLARKRLEPFAVEDVAILQAGSKRASRLIERVNSGRTDPFREFPFLVTGAALHDEVFRYLVEMELRLATQEQQPVELAIAELGAPASPAAIQAVQRAVDPCRWAIGEHSDRHIAFFKRAADAVEIRRQIETATEALRTVAPVSGVGAVAVQAGATAAVDAPMLIQLAERELCFRGGTGQVERLLLGPAPMSFEAGA
jgi:hypothetical protein